SRNSHCTRDCEQGWHAMSQGRGTEQVRVLLLLYSQLRRCRRVATSQRIWRSIMGKSWKILAVAVIAGVTSWLTAPADAAPLASSGAQKRAGGAAVDSVQGRRGQRGRGMGPAGGFAAGVAIGSALAPPYYSYGYPAYDYGYGAYAYAPGYAYVPAR